jgi:hypothetical protein
MSESTENNIRASIDTSHSSNEISESVKWRAMEETIEQVGDWAVRALPTLLEIVKKGGRYDVKDLDILRPSFRSAVELAHAEWMQKKQMPNFVEFVLAREQAGEDFRVHKSKWSNKSRNCECCSDVFGVTNRKHHCRWVGRWAIIIANTYLCVLILFIILYYSLIVFIPIARQCIVIYKYLFEYINASYVMLSFSSLLIQIMWWPCVR